VEGAERRRGEEAKRRRGEEAKRREKRDFIANKNRERWGGGLIFVRNDGKKRTPKEPI
jgi:hypothetical protein